MRKYLNTIKNNTIDLILTDPPYIISRESGMNTHYENVKENEKNNVEFVKTEEEWQQYKIDNGFDTDDKKENSLVAYHYKDKEDVVKEFIEENNGDEVSPGCIQQ